jgi:Ca2+-binding EF-hand superfamily protein
MSFLAAAALLALSPRAALALGPRLLRRKRLDRPSFFEAIDSDHDGTLDLAEVQHAASTSFDELDIDHDGTLSRRELGLGRRRRLSAAEFAAADTDKDGTLTKDEYLGVVEQRFKAADADHNGKLTAVQFLKSKAGLALQRMLSFPGSTTR